MISKYRLTNLFVNFTDCPASLEMKKFKRQLIGAGFIRFDTRTYFRPTAPERVTFVIDALTPYVPCAATVRVIRVTDRQWSDAKVIIGK